MRPFSLLNPPGPLTALLSYRSSLSLGSHYRPLVTPYETAAEVSMSLPPKNDKGYLEITESANGLSVVGKRNTRTNLPLCSRNTVSAAGASRMSVSVKTHCAWPGARTRQRLRKSWRRTRMPKGPKLVP